MVAVAILETDDSAKILAWETILRVRFGFIYFHSVEFVVVFENLHVKLFRIFRAGAVLSQLVAVDGPFARKIPIVVCVGLVKECLMLHSFLGFCSFESGIVDGPLLPSAFLGFLFERCRIYRYCSGLADDLALLDLNTWG